MRAVWTQDGRCARQPSVGTSCPVTLPQHVHPQHVQEALQKSRARRAQAECGTCRQLQAELPDNAALDRVLDLAGYTRADTRAGSLVRTRVGARASAARASAGAGGASASDGAGGASASDGAGGASASAGDARVGTRVGRWSSDEVDVVIKGLRATGSSGARRISKEIAARWHDVDPALWKSARDYLQITARATAGGVGMAAALALYVLDVHEVGGVSFGQKRPLTCTCICT